MSKNFDELTAATALTGTETFAANQSGVTKKVTAAQIATHAGGSAVVTHESAYNHADISHTNRAALDLISGTNTGDQDLTGLAPIANPVFTGGISLPNSNNANANVLDWYMEGAWTPVDASGANLTLTVTDCKYTRIGRMVFLTGKITYPATADTNTATISGLPYAPVNTFAAVAFTDSGSITATAIKVASDGTLKFYNNLGSATARLNSNLSALTHTINIAYMV